MNKKGFTLVELLAVIVILAIVVLVTTPAILNVINNSREKGAEDKAWGTINAVRLAYTQAQTKGYEDSEGNGVSVSGDNLIVTFSDGTEAFGNKKITMTGERPTSGTVTINKATGTTTCTDLYFKENGTFYCTTTDGKSMKCTKGIIGGNDVEVVTSGDGLYKDSTELGRYVYKGADPNNYITLGSDTYRIISVESDGTLKVIKNGSIVSMAFDTSNTRYSTVSTDYCNSTYGCKVWGSKTTTLNSSGSNVTTMPREVGGTEYNLPDAEATLNTYLNNDWYNSLDSNVKSKVVTHMFNVGVTKKNETSLANTITQEQAYKWKGKVGLMNPSDYVKASTNSACTSVSEYYSNSSCYNNSATHNWIFAGPVAKSSSWTIAPFSHSSANLVFYVCSGGYLTGYGASISLGAAPVLYLSSNIQLSGKGTSGEPFTIS